MKLYRLALYKGLLLLFFCPLLYADNLEFIKDVLPVHEDKPLAISFSYGEYNESLDVLNYADKLTGSKPKSADLSSLSLSYTFSNSLKISSQYTKSSALVERLTIPKRLQTETEASFLSLAYEVWETSSNIFELEFFFKEEKQDPLTIDCYEFGSLVVGGSCPEAKISFLDAEIYKSTGELVHKPVLVTEGKSEAFGITLRIKGLQSERFNINHTLSFESSEVSIEYTSDLLSTTDTLIRSVPIGGSTTGEMLDRFKSELPQTSPWTENTFKYSLNSTYGLTKRTALAGRLGFVKISRSDYEPNPTKKDYKTNYLLDFGIFFSVSESALIYSRLSLSTNYLLGVNSLAYNRRSNHLFDHPYGQLYIGALIQF